MFSNSTAARSHHHRTRREWRWAQPLRFLQLPRSGGLLWAVALPGRQNNGVRLRSEPPTIAGAAATGSRLTPISRAVGCNLISRGPAPEAAVRNRGKTVPLFDHFVGREQRRRHVEAERIDPRARSPSTSQESIPSLGARSHRDTAAIAIVNSCL